MMDTLSARLRDTHRRMTSQDLCLGCREPWPCSGIEAAEVLAGDLAICESCGWIQSEHNWCQKCGYRTVWPSHPSYGSGPDWHCEFDAATSRVEPQGT